MQIKCFGEGPGHGESKIF